MIHVPNGHGGLTAVPPTTDAAGSGGDGQLHRASSATARVEHRSGQLVPVDCYATDGQLLLDGVELGARTLDGRVEWRPAVLVDGRTHLATDHLPPGRYTAHARRSGRVASARTVVVTA